MNDTYSTFTEKEWEMLKDAVHGMAVYWRTAHETSKSDLSKQQYESWMALLEKLKNF